MGLFNFQQQLGRNMMAGGQVPGTQGMDPRLMMGFQGQNRVQMPQTPGMQNQMGQVATTPGPATPAPTPERQGWGMQSLSQQVSGHDPSLYNVVANGGDMGEWFSKGGPSPGISTLQKFSDDLGMVPKINSRSTFLNPFGIDF